MPPWPKSPASSGPFEDRTSTIPRDNETLDDFRAIKKIRGIPRVPVDERSMSKYGGKVPRGTNDTDRGKLLNNLVQMVQDAVAVINDDESINALEFQSKSASADIYERLISASNREVSKAILGQTLSTELDNKGGSRAAAQAHLEVRDDIVEKDKRTVKTTMNQMLAWMTELNVPGALPPEFTWFEEDDVQQDRALRDTELTNQGVRFTAGYYSRVYNLEDDDFTLTGPEEKDPKPEKPSKPDPKPEKPSKPEFAEDEQPADTADQMADRMDAKAGAMVEELLNPIRDLVMTATSLEEIRNSIIDLYPDMNSSDLGSLMQRAITAAQLAGMAEVKDGK